ncbi:hypothetical protein EVAR_75397_1 [Eumeta japonica]|uniref:Uncharacterized protein n=1 Tax=Eumeta variegata TaxID=151549 RepID=A0A4C1TJY7_EUMVA|nr:hypothetical protein EVAR_75397_1 [Eumeta japonica]
MEAWLKMKTKHSRTVRSASFCSYLTGVGRLNGGGDDADADDDGRRDIASDGDHEGTGDRGVWSESFSPKATICCVRREAEFRTIRVLK